MRGGGGGETNICFLEKGGGEDALGRKASWRRFFPAAEEGRLGAVQEEGGKKKNFLLWLARDVKRGGGGEGDRLRRWEGRLSKGGA